jgi:hypothetical protein
MLWEASCDQGSGVSVPFKVPNKSPRRSIRVAERSADRAIWQPSRSRRISREPECVHPVIIGSGEHSAIGHGR